MKVQTTRAMLLETGLRMLSVQGLSGVTLGGLARASGLSKSGIFAHFTSKTRLQLDLFGRMVDVAQEHVARPAQEAPEGLPRLRVLIERWLCWSERAGLRGGCPVAAALFELDDLDGEVRAYCGRTRARVARDAAWPRPARHSTRASGCRYRRSPVRLGAVRNLSSASCLGALLARPH